MDNYCKTCNAQFTTDWFIYCPICGNKLQSEKESEIDSLLKKAEYESSQVLIDLIKYIQKYL